MELKVFTNQMTGYFARVLFKDDDAAKYAAIIEDFPFLNTVDAKFVYDYKASKGHYPMFFVSWRYFSGCVKKQTSYIGTIMAWALQIQQILRNWPMNTIFQEKEYVK